MDTYYNISATNLDSNHWTIQYIFPHSKIDLMSFSSAVDSASICNHYLKFWCWIYKAIESFGKFTVNEIMSSTTINQHYYLSLFDISFYLESLRGENSIQCMTRYGGSNLFESIHFCFFTLRWLLIIYLFLFTIYV